MNFIELLNLLPAQKSDNFVNTPECKEKCTILAKAPEKRLRGQKNRSEDFTGSFLGAEKEARF